MKIKFNPLREMLLTILVMSLPFYFINKQKKGGSDTMHQYFLDFDSSDIKGVVDTFTVRFHMEMFQVNNSKKEYLFHPDITSQGYFFHAFTEKGDSIIKPPYSTVLLVKSKDKTYTYTFEKF
jgi:hypothetical protein